MWTSLSRCLVLASRCHTEGVLKWTGLNRYPVLAQDIISRELGPGRGVSLYRGGVPCIMRSNASWIMVTWDLHWTECKQTDVKILPFHNFVGRSKITSQLENEFYCIKHWWGLYEQNNIVTSFHVDDWTAEWVMMKYSYCTSLLRREALAHDPDTVDKDQRFRPRTCTS